MTKIMKINKRDLNVVTRAYDVIKIFLYSALKIQCRIIAPLALIQILVFFIGRVDISNACGMLFY